MSRDRYDEPEEKGFGFFGVLMVAIAIVIFALAAFLVVTLVRQNSTEGVQDDIVWDMEDETETEQSADSSGTTVLGVVYIESNVNIRDYPDTETGQVLGVAKAGDTYAYTGLSADGNWYCIVLADGSTGYVYSQYVSLTD